MAATSDPPQSGALRATPWRLFVAVPVPSHVRAAVKALVDALPATTPSVRWVRIDGLHVTLRFLGPTPPGRVDAVAEAVGSLAAETPPFDVTIAGAGAFPSPARPRVLWLGIREGADAFASLAARLDDALAAAGWSRDPRPFRAHLTLARTDGLRSGPDVARDLVAAGESFGASFRADRLSVMRTHTGRGPARYEEIRGWRLES